MKHTACFFLVLIATCSGCAGGSSGSISSWQQSVERYVNDRGKGDPLALRDVTLADGRRGFATIGGPVPAESNDVSGLLLGHRAIDGRPWFIYLVGEVKRQQVSDIRVAALSAENGKFTWKVSGRDQAALQAYQKHRARPAQGFPAPDDRFDLGLENRNIAVTHPPSGAQWELDLSR